MRDPLNAMEEVVALRVGVARREHRAVPRGAALRAAEGGVPVAAARDHPAAEQAQLGAPVRLAELGLGGVADEQRGIEPPRLGRDRLQQHLPREAQRPDAPAQALHRRRVEALRPGGAARAVEQRHLEPREAVEVRLAGAVQAVLRVRRADEQQRALRRQHELRLGEARAQVGALARRVAGVGHLHVVADDEVGARAGDVAEQPLREHRGVAQRRTATPHGEAVRRPRLLAGVVQVAAERVPLDHAADVADHALRERLLGGEHDDARLGPAVQPPRAEQPGERGLAAAAERHQHQPAVGCRDAGGEPARDAAVHARRGLVVEVVPDPDELDEVRLGHGLAHRCIVLSPMGSSCGFHRPFAHAGGGGFAGGGAPREGVGRHRRGRRLATPNRRGDRALSLRRCRASPPGPRP